MLIGPNSDTRATLIGRVGRDANDASAWAEFVTLYGRRIVAWCSTWGLQDADAREVTQDVLVYLAVHLRDFRYDPTRSFRAWLKKLTRRAWQDFLRARKRDRPGSGGSGVMDRLDTVAARDDLTQRLAEAFDEELYWEAVARVRVRVEPRTWDAFRLLAEDHWWGGDAAPRRGGEVA